MTIRAYITDKFKAFGISESQMIDIAMSSGLNLDDDVESQNPNAVGVAVVDTLEELILAPRLTNVSENGFSMSWDYGSIGKYYSYLCRKWGITPNEDVLALLGINALIDKTEIW